MRSRARQIYQKWKWHPYFVWWPTRITFRNLAGKDEPHPNVRMWVWLEWIECKVNIDMPKHPWEYRLPTQEK